jgi:hypothetical protein
LSILVPEHKLLELVFCEPWWVEEFRVGMVWLEGEARKPPVFLRGGGFGVVEKLTAVGSATSFRCFRYLLLRYNRGEYRISKRMDNEKIVTHSLRSDNLPVVEIRRCVVDGNDKFVIKICEPSSESQRAYKRIKTDRSR